MSGGYADALGVACEYCHNVRDFSSDEKRPKRAAREMQIMHKGVNTQLRAMTELASQPADQRAINCTTCHRGRIKPD
jgi:Photosynthetic reaction centre cytochrome C subunit